MLAAALVIVGIQIFFTSFLLSHPRPARRRRVASASRSRCATGARCSARCSPRCAPRRSSAELVVADTAPPTGRPTLARSFGATVVPVERFSHGGTRNLLMERTLRRARGVPDPGRAAGAERWLEALLGGFSLADDVALVYGPSRRCRARRGRSRASWTSGSRWRRSRASTARATPAGPGRWRRSSPSPTARVSRAAWRDVPFPDVPYAEDQALARAMLRAGYAKVYVPDAAVVHSHDYAALDAVPAHVRRVARAARGPRLGAAAGAARTRCSSCRARSARTCAACRAARRACARRRARCATGPSAPPARSRARARTGCPRACARGARSRTRLRDVPTVVGARERRAVRRGEPVSRRFLAPFRPARGAASRSWPGGGTPTVTGVALTPRPRRASPAGARRGVVLGGCPRFATKGTKGDGGVSLRAS